MEGMDMHSRNEYLKVLKEKYFNARTKKKPQILNEYGGNATQAREYVLGRYKLGISEAEGSKNMVAPLFHICPTRIP